MMMFVSSKKEGGGGRYKCEPLSQAIEVPGAAKAELACKKKIPILGFLTSISRRFPTM